VGYFDGMTDALFKKQADGGVVFYPWGAMGNGYLVTQPQKASRLRAFVRGFYVITGPLFILLGTLLRGRALWVIAPLFVIFTAWYAMKTRQMLAGVPRCTERFSIKEGYARTAASSSAQTLRLRRFFFACLLVAVMGILLMLVAHTRERLVTGAIATVLSAAAAAVFGYMLTTRRS
jgi:hypothetical protein